MSVLNNILAEAGWYPGRTIQLPGNSLIAEQLPIAVKQFIAEFSGLNIRSYFESNQLIQEIEILTAEDFFNLYTSDEFVSNKFSSELKVDITKGENDETYYYSALIGIQLYPVAHLREQGTLFIDEKNNVYELNFLPQLNWIGNGVLRGIETCLFRNNEYMALDDINMIWITKDGNPSTLSLPLNEVLDSINPW
jgi:hypothetical protein